MFDRNCRLRACFLHIVLVLENTLRSYCGLLCICVRFCTCSCIFVVGSALWQPCYVFESTVATASSCFWIHSPSLFVSYNCIFLGDIKLLSRWGSLFYRQEQGSRFVYCSAVDRLPIEPAIAYVVVQCRISPVRSAVGVYSLSSR
jgi:hypothetical protein